MNQGIALLDEALTLAQREKTALENGEYEDAIEMAEKRGQLTGMACNMMALEDQAPYHGKLLELSNLQKQLTDIATRAHSAVRARLNRSRLEKKRMQGYHLAVGQALQ